MNCVWYRVARGFLLGKLYLYSIKYAYDNSIEFRITWNNSKYFLDNFDTF